MSDRKISDYQFSDLGIEHSQYFQGFGTTFTPYEYAATGSGSNLREAIDDCLEQIASDGFDIATLERELAAEVCGELGIAPADLDAIPDDTGSVETYLMEHNAAEWTDENGDFDGKECELYYYVGIRWNETPNLDAMDDSDLDKLADDSSFPEALRDYATIKAHAMRARASGRINVALALENTCDSLYRKLADNLRW